MQRKVVLQLQPIYPIKKHYQSTIGYLNPISNFCQPRSLPAWSRRGGLVGGDTRVILNLLQWFDNDIIDGKRMQN